jgi:hypothetical protein
MQLCDGLEAFSLRLFTKVLGWTSERVLVHTSKVKEDLKNSRIHAMQKL